MDGWFYGLVTAIKNILAWLCCLGVLCLKCPFKVIENITGTHFKIPKIKSFEFEQFILRKL